MINKIRNLNLNVAVSIYILITFLHAFVARIIPISVILDDRIDSMIFILLAIVGCLLLFLDFIGRRVMFKGEYSFLLIIFLGILGISSVINIKYGFVDNLKTINWTAVHMCIFYTYFTRMNKEEMDKKLYIAFNIISWIWTIAVLYSLKQYIVVDCYGVELEPSIWKNQGFRNGRLYGVFNDPNFAAVTSSYVVLMLLYIFMKCKKNWIKVLCVISMILQVFYIVLSGSRTAMLCIVCVSALWLVLILKRKFINYKVWKRWMLRGGIFIVGLFLLFLSETLINKALSYIPKLYMEYEIVNIEEDLTPEEDLKNYNIQTMSEEGMLKRDDIKKENISNNRFSIWKAYIKGMKGRYLIGASPRNIVSYFMDHDEQGYMGIRKYETHNGFISVFAGSGVIGLVTIVAFLILLARRTLIVLLKNKTIDIEFLIIASIVLMIVIYSCFFTELFFVNNLTTVIFWTLLGSFRFWLEKKNI